MAYPQFMSENMTSRICVGNAGGSKPENGTYESLLMALQKCYENDT